MSVATAAIALFFRLSSEKPDRLIAILDIFSVGLHAAVGADKFQMVYELSPHGSRNDGLYSRRGGMLRDVFLGQTPGIFPARQLLYNRHRRSNILRRPCRELPRPQYLCPGGLRHHHGAAVDLAALQISSRQRRSISTASRDPSVVWHVAPLRLSLKPVHWCCRSALDGAPRTQADTASAAARKRGAQAPGWLSGRSTAR